MRVAVVTGGMGGLGESISTKMHDAGYSVAVTHSPSNTKVKDWLASQNASGRKFTAYRLTSRIMNPALNVLAGSLKISDQLIFW